MESHITMDDLEVLPFWETSILRWLHWLHFISSIAGRSCLRVSFQSRFESGKGMKR